MAGIALGEKQVVPVRPPEYPLDPAVYESYMGKYEGEDGTSLIVERSGDNLFFIFQDEYTIPFYPVSETLFHHTVIDREYEFERDSEGNILFLGIKKSRGIGELKR
ncbi:DUF3471 domain-containing protein [Paenibacillus alkalitolerans]|uniref:DUF3471 domain-containing protein n=1 Tax=Paenibacillus alkalitolerans TaxID=2799335 RepID=UPI001F170A62|nr:DUF3471 domain-containing protein [Paenibacillus alkalitolerans]